MIGGGSDDDFNVNRHFYKIYKCWNRYWSHDSRVKLIVCGSSASWIIEKIINNKGGLYNRVTRTISLAPFNLHETEKFLSAAGIKLNRQQITLLYMALGGIPHYLALLPKGRSSSQCLGELCFQKSGALIQEFERLFGSLFNEPETYINLIRIMANSPYGIGQAELIKQSGASDGGRIKEKLKQLEEADFIMSFIPHGHERKGIYYKIIDEFSLFYLRWMEPNLSTILKQTDGENYWLAKSTSPHWRVWTGLAFEALCHKHLAQIRAAAAISAGANIGSWRFVSPDSTQPGAQIDLLFDRDDGVITICEIKYNDQPYSINKDYAHKLLNKVAVYKKRSGTKKQIFIIMVTANGLKPTLYSEEIIQGVTTIEDLFQESAR